MRVKVVLARVIEFLFTKLYNVSHFAGIPAVPLFGLKSLMDKGFVHILYLIFTTYHAPILMSGHWNNCGSIPK
jgi:hypothetical protein